MSNRDREHTHLRAAARAATVVGLGVATVALAPMLATGASAAPPAADRPQRPMPSPTSGTGAPLPTPAAVAPDDGSVPIGAYRVETGTQTYTCGADGVWSAASVPSATLVDGRGHRLAHSAGPRWAVPDGSTVVGVVGKRVPAPGTIAWLLLDVSAHEGPAGALTGVTHISRVFTQGGTAPGGACTPGTTTSPTYRAVYVLWGRPTADRTGTDRTA